MTRDEPNPPRWAAALLSIVVRTADRESIPGDLLEEFRASRLPALGRRRADAWYCGQVASLFWHLIRPCALFFAVIQILLAAPMLVALDPRGPMFVVASALVYGSPVQAPGISLFDALVYMCAGCLAARRTGLVTTGMLAGGATSFVGFTAMFVTFAIAQPRLLLAPFAMPFIFVILAVLLSIALSCGCAAGLVGGVIGRSIPSRASTQAGTGS